MNITYTYSLDNHSAQLVEERVAQMNPEAGCISMVLQKNGVGAHVSLEFDFKNKLYYIWGHSEFIPLFPRAIIARINEWISEFKVNDDY